MATRLETTRSRWSGLTLNGRGADPRTRSSLSPCPVICSSERASSAKARLRSSFGETSSSSRPSARSSPVNDLARITASRSSGGVVPAPLVRRQVEQQQIRVAQDRGELVLEVVDDAPGQPAEGLEPTARRPLGLRAHGPKDEEAPAPATLRRVFRAGRHGWRIADARLPSAGTRPPPVGRRRPRPRRPPGPPRPAGRGSAGAAR